MLLEIVRHPVVLNVIHTYLYLRLRCGRYLSDMVYNHQAIGMAGDTRDLNICQGSNLRETGSVPECGNNINLRYASYFE